MIKNIIFVILILFLYCCKSRNKNYINYYQEVNKVDSIFKIKKDSLVTIKKYRNIFRKYTPKNQEKIEEFETYILLSDKYKKKYGGEKSLIQLLYLIAPYWNNKREDSVICKLYNKNGFDSIHREKIVEDWNINIRNKKLVDSFSIAFIRNQANIDVSEESLLNNKKNAKLLKWSFENYGFPSVQKIGIYGNDSVFMPMGNLLSNIIDIPFTEDEVDYFMNKLVEYVKSGDCPPRDYAIFTDRYNFENNIESKFGVLYDGFELDTLKINKNRINIGLPTLQHSKLLNRSFKKK